MLYASWVVYLAGMRKQEGLSERRDSTMKTGEDRTKPVYAKMAPPHWPFTDLYPCYNTKNRTQGWRLTCRLHTRHMKKHDV